jgi:hypothetical protein
MKGYYWDCLTRAIQFKTAEDVQKGVEQLRKAADYYFEAAKVLPADEEYRACMECLICGFYSSPEMLDRASEDGARSALHMWRTAFRHNAAHGIHPPR